ncbi:S-adenosyl-L-methionine-dependent methyltransferase [Didymella exigua CBS 183.55]|uniref:S-adenosyl-L-methionine-dependent methyltransferase n=1 Tax=Didymella exigua CBS 183.55 TaxID=1150837 RepID=A0A6A5RY42_9PLEO|nr:S-adenosyl-L-methionine-dependent methyltransferase [Didymella exigua CBS 183.55]KAF1933321.1 S-adenosyl-L-methionine-dependent methyltransferase [Didymella exigua CBS 183.55]
MTQPSIDSTFDTSLVDLNPNVSFSTTESDPSDAGTSTTTQQISIPSPLAREPNQHTPQAPQAMPPKTSTPVQHIGIQEAYDQWATVYDTDGNMLQSIDDDELNALLPSLLDRLAWSPASSVAVLDLGCGTGRNTARLLSYAWPSSKSISVTGLDFSAGMLALARAKLTPIANARKNAALRLEHCDPFPQPPTAPSNPPTSLALPRQDLVISTLVLEHIPLPTFFATLAALLAPGGTALVTNMHAEMGSRSQAGFVNADGVKVRGKSYVYTLAQTVQGATDAGLAVVSARERSVAERDVEDGVVGKRGAKWIGCKVWFGVVVRRV